MARSRAIRAIMPLAGYHRAFAIQRQPPYTFIDAKNVQPRDTLEDRLRGGPRPGVLHVMNGDSETFGSGSPVRGLFTLQTITSDTFRIVHNEFADGPLSAPWSPIMQNASLTFDMPIAGGGALRIGPSADNRGAVHALPGDMDRAETHGIALLLDLQEGWSGNTITLFNDMDDDHPTIDPLDSPAYAAATVALSLVAGSGNMQLDWLFATFSGSGTGSGTYFIDADTIPGQMWIVLLMVPEPGGAWTMRLYVHDIQLAARTGITDTAGRRSGFWAQTTGGNPAIIPSIRVTYNTPSGSITNSSIVAISNSVVHIKSTRAGGIATATATPSGMTILSTRPRAAQLFQRLYIADHEAAPQTRQNGQIASRGIANDNQVEVWDAFAPTTNWSTSYSATHDIIEVFDVRGAGVAAGAYRIAGFRSAAATNDRILLRVEDAGLRADQGGVCKFRLWAPPKVFTPGVNTLSQWLQRPGKGSIPIGCHLICNWRGRIVLADRYNIYMSAVGEPDNWDYFAGSEVSTRAIFLQAAQAGMFGDEVMALIPASDDYLLIGGRNSMYLLRGDPAAGGQMGPLEHSLGVVGPDAWCCGPGGVIYYLSRIGLMVLAPGGGYPQPVAQERTPSDLRVERAYTNEGHFMVWDIRSRLIRIYSQVAVTTDTTEYTHWAFDLENNGFWPFTTRAKHGPFAVCDFPDMADYESAFAGMPTVLLGGKDGRVRMYNALVAVDDQVDQYAITNYVWLGPFLSGDGSELTGILREIVGILDGASGSVSWSVHVGATAEAAFAAAACASGTFGPGRSHIQPLRREGAYFFLKLSGAGAAWALEQIECRISLAGLVRF